MAQSDWVIYAAVLVGIGTPGLTSARCRRLPRCGRLGGMKSAPVISAGALDAPHFSGNLKQHQEQSL